MSAATGRIINVDRTGGRASGPGAVEALIIFRAITICTLACTILFAAATITLGALTLKGVIGSSVLANYCIVVGSLSLVSGLCGLCQQTLFQLQKPLQCLAIAVAIAFIIGGAMVLKGAWPSSTLGYMAISHGAFSIVAGCIATVWGLILIERLIGAAAADVPAAAWPGEAEVPVRGGSHTTEARADG